MFSFFHLIFSLLLLCCFLHFSPHLAVRTNHSIICADPYYDEGSRPIIISIFDHHHLHLRPLCSLSLSSLSQSMWFLSQKFLGACMLILAREIEGKHEENRGSWTTQFLKKTSAKTATCNWAFLPNQADFGLKITTNMLLEVRRRRSWCYPIVVMLLSSTTFFSDEHRQKIFNMWIFDCD